MTYDFDYYSGRDLTFPSMVKRPAVPTKQTPAELRDYADRLEDYEKLKEERAALLKRYNTASNERLTEFMNVLRDDYDLSQPQFDLIWSSAWEDGHSGGLYEVYGHFDALYEFATKFAALES